MANAGQITYEDQNQVEQKLDVFHFKDGTVRVKKRGGPIGAAGDTVVFLNGNFVNDSLHYEFGGIATSIELAEESMLKEISVLVNASVDGLGGNSNGWTKPEWLEGGLEGKVQSIIPLKNKGAIRLTVAKYYLPSGKSISEVGVRPDIEVNEEGDDFRIKTETDNQLNYAIKLLNG